MRREVRSSISVPAVYDECTTEQKVCCELGGEHCAEAQESGVRSQEAAVVVGLLPALG